MENNLALSKNDELDEHVGIIFDEFGKSMVALQTQDVQTSEQALLKAKSAFGIVSLHLDTSEIIPFRIMCSFMEVGTRLIKSTFYSFEERYKKSLEELQFAKAACVDAASNFENIPPALRTSDDFAVFMPLFKNLLICFDAIIDSTSNHVESQIMIEEDKFVDEIKILKESVSRLRRINSMPFENDAMNLTVALVTMINKIADLSEKRAERLEEKRKKIDFVRPIDNKIFIVHGHNTAILSELTNMLRNEFRVQPIILTEMPDKGNTLIEKFEEYGRYCAFAFVIVTPDDIVENKKKKYFQGRPNVLFELGWFCGRFGRSKVRILRQKNTELPSDLNGLVTIDFHEKLEEVFRRISADLEENGIIARKNQMLN